MVAEMYDGYKEVTRSPSLRSDAQFNLNRMLHTVKPGDYDDPYKSRMVDWEWRNYHQFMDKWQHLLYNCRIIPKVKTYGREM